MRIIFISVIIIGLIGCMPSNPLENIEQGSSINLDNAQANEMYQKAMGMAKDTMKSQMEDMQGQ